jgi:hypothetical protein
MASHLTLEEREVIAHMHRLGKMQTQIAERLGRSKSTISRDVSKIVGLMGHGRGLFQPVTSLSSQIARNHPLLGPPDGFRE